MKILDDNHKNSSCDFAGTLVLYLYGEAPKPESIEFEGHLKNCLNCADELESFAALRNSLFEWKEDFTAIKTPAFVLPNEKQRKFAKEVTNGNEKRPRFSDFGKLFSFFPKLAAGFAVAAICFGLFLFALRFSQNNELVQNDLNTINSNASFQVIDKKIQQAEESGLSGNSDDNPVKAQKSENKNLSEKAATPARFDGSRNSSVKISGISQTAAKNYKSTQNKIKSQTIREKQVYNSQRLTATSKKNPTLVEVGDEEDDSMRLADLFEEVGGR